MKALALFERWGKSRGNRRKQRGGWRRPARSALHFEPLEQRRMLSVNAALLADLNVGVDSSSPTDFVEMGDITFFVAEDDLVGRELWKTDGTAEGTEAVMDIYQGGYSYDAYTDQGHQYVVTVLYGSDPQDLVVVSGMLYFTADDGENGRELWISDGTADNTEMVVDLYGGTYSDDGETVANASDPQELTNVNGTLVFTATNDEAGRELWMSNGTVDGTVMIKDINPSDDAEAEKGSSPQELTAVGGTLLFTADDGTTGRELWTTNGTEDGTVQVADIADGAAGSDPASLTVFGSTLYFTANDGADGTELWKTDGDGGVVQVDDINPGAAGADPASLIVVDGTLYFTANDGTDGTELWKTDGSGGVVQVEDINPGSDGSDPTSLTDVNGTLYFAATDGTTGTELWKTGSAIQVMDINPGSVGSNPSSLVNLDGILYFSADDGVHGSEVWVSTGTSSGTFLLEDINAGSEGSDPASLTNIGGALYFSADDGEHEQEPWIHTPAKLSIFIDGQQVALPIYLGVGNDGNISHVYTVDGSGRLLVSAVGDDPAPETVTLGYVFETWRTNAGLAGNNPDAVFSDQQILGNSVDATHKIQLFVNGIASQEFEDYAIQGGDEIAIVYTSNEVVSLNTNAGSILIELYDGVAPGTVENFLNYANDGDWIRTFVHRSASTFVVQLGGFTTPSDYFQGTQYFSSVPTDAAIENEFDISNTRGTIAMAKLGGNPDSATSQFFFNLGDNSENLDAQNGGFTVFAKVLDMTVVDTIAAFATEDLDGTSATLYDAVPFTEANELVVVESIGGEGEVYGTVFDDLDGDGVQGSGEPGREGITVYIDENDDGVLDEGEFSLTSDANGDYSFRYQAGEYVLRQELGEHRYQTSAPDGYDLSVEMGRETASLDFGSLEVVPPSSVDLMAATDSGTDDDELTNFNNSTAELAMQYYVTGGETGAEIRVYAGDVLIGSAIAASPVTVTTDGTTTLAEGEHTITVTQVLHEFESEPWEALVVTIDTAPPAAFETVAPVLAWPGALYEYDADSLDEATPGATISLVDAPDGMEVTQTGLITWTPTEAQEGVHQFELRITDDAGNYSAESIVLTVLGDPPAHPDDYTVDEDGELEVTADEGVLDNDGENQAGLAGTATLVSGPSHGTLVEFNADGSFTYVPDAEFSGTDLFTYVANDGSGDTNEAPVTITVAAVNDPPEAVADFYGVAEDGSLEVTAEEGVLKNDSDIDNAMILANLVDDVDHGVLDFDNDGSFTYTPDEDFFGTDTFTYQATDGNSVSATVTVTITVNAVNDSPEVVNSQHTVAEDGALDVLAASGVLLDATDPDGDNLSAVLGDAPDHGTLTLNTDGSFTYEPDADYYGTDSFTFRASDGTNQSGLGTVTITVDAEADPPSAVDDAFDVTGGDPVVLDVLDNDTTAPDGVQTKTIISVSQGSEGGEVTISSNGDEVTYTPSSAFSGTETFTYTIEDSDGLTSQATVTATVTPGTGEASISGYVYCDSNNDGVRDANEAGVPGVMITLTGVDDQGNSVETSALTSNDGSYVFEQLWAGTYEISERQPLVFRDGIDTIGTLGGTVEDDYFSEVELTAQGESADNNFGERGLAAEYIRLDMFFASTPSLAGYLRDMLARAEELAGNTAIAAQIREGATDVGDGTDTNGGGNGSNDEAATAVDDVYSVDEESVLTVSVANGLLDNDVDADEDPVDASDVTAVLVTDVDQGDLTLSDDGSFTYTPDDTDASYTDSFTYKLTDGTLESNEATVTITVSAVVAGNAAPVAVNDEYQINEDNQLTADADAGVLDNDADAEDDPLTAVVAASPLHGSLSLAGDGSFIYIPNSNFSGTDSFTYTANDGELDSSQATVTITVSAVNDAPTVADNDYQTAEDSVLTIDAAAGVLDNDGDVDGSPASALTSLVITEVNYNPADPRAAAPTPNSSFERGDFEFIELKNVGASTIDLNGVEFTEGITFAFSGSDVTQLAAGGKVLVVKNKSAFEAGYGTAVNVAGEFASGSLSDDGERIRLENSLGGTIHDFLYDDEGNWPPAADGGGATLQVVDVTGDYDNPFNWVSGYGVGGSPGTASNTAAAVDRLMALLVDEPDHGDLVLGDDGSFTYTPDAGFDGSDSFTYRASDGTNVSEEATVTIEVTPSGS